MSIPVGCLLYLYQLAENVSPGTSVATVAATDADAGTDGVITYSMSGGGSQFSINPDTGKIETIAALDFETTTSYR